MSDLDNNRGSVNSGSVTKTGFNFSSYIGTRSNKSSSGTGIGRTIRKQDVIDFNVELDSVDNTNPAKSSLLKNEKGPINPNFYQDYLTQMERIQKRVELKNEGYLPEDIERLMNDKITKEKLDEEIYQEYCGGNVKRYRSKVEAKVMNYLYFDREEFEENLKVSKETLEDLDSQYTTQSEYYKGEIQKYSAIINDAEYDSVKERYVYTDSTGNVMEFTADEYEELKTSLHYFEQKNANLDQNYEEQRKDLVKAVDYYTTALSDPERKEFKYKSVAEIDSEIAYLKQARQDLIDGITEREYDTIPTQEETVAILDSKPAYLWFGLRKTDSNETGITCVKMFNGSFTVYKNFGTFENYSNAEEMAAAGYYVQPDHRFALDNWVIISKDTEEINAEIKELEDLKGQVESIINYPLKFDKYTKQPDFEKYGNFEPIVFTLEDLQNMDNVFLLKLGGYYDVLAEGRVMVDPYLHEAEYIEADRLKTWNDSGVIDEYDPNIKKVYAYLYRTGKSEEADKFLESYFPIFDSLYLKKQMPNDAAYGVSDSNTMGLKDLATLGTNIYYSWKGIYNNNILRYYGKEVYNTDVYNPATVIHSAISQKYYEKSDLYGGAMQVVYSLDQQAINLLLIYLLGGGGAAGAGAAGAGNIALTSYSGGYLQNLLSNITFRPEVLLSSTIVYGGPSFNNAYFDAKYNRHLDDNQAYLLALLTASTEIATESLATCHLLGLDSACENVLNSGIINSQFASRFATLTHMSPETASKVLAVGYTMITQGAFEFSEEYETTCLTYLWDTLITGNESKINMKIENYKRLNPGCSDFDAVASALLEVNKEATDAGKMGFVCGFITAGAMGTSYSDISNPLGVDYVVNPNVQIDTDVQVNNDVQVDQQVVDNNAIQIDAIEDIDTQENIDLDQQVEDTDIEEMIEVEAQDTEVVEETEVQSPADISRMVVNEYLENIEEMQKQGISFQDYLASKGIKTVTFDSKATAAQYLGDAKLYVLDLVSKKSKDPSLAFRYVVEIVNFDSEFRGVSVADIDTADLIAKASPFLTPSEIQTANDLLANGQTEVRSRNASKAELNAIFNYTQCGGFEINAWLNDAPYGYGGQTGKGAFTSIEEIQDQVSGLKLRDGRANKVFPVSDGLITDSLDSYIANTSYGDAIVTYRGVKKVFNFDTEIDVSTLKPGSEFTTEGYQSSSVVIDNCFAYNSSTTNTILEIVVPPNSGSAAYIENVTGVCDYGQMEMLVKRNATLVVVGDVRTEVINGIPKTIIPVTIKP